MALDGSDLWEDQVYGLVMLRCLYANRKDIVERLNPSWTVALWKFEPEYELPSYCVIQRDKEVRVFVAGTTNGWQSFGHGKGYLGITYGLGAVNRAWRQVAPRLQEALAEFLPARNDIETEVTVYGHSYGGALAQIVSDLEADAGRDMRGWRVLAIASPKPYTSLVPDLRHKVNILRSVNDVVTTYPFGFAPVFQVDPILGVIPFPNPLAEWEHRGDVQALASDGQLVDDEQPGSFDTNRDFGLSFEAHQTRRYIERLEARRKLQGWEESIRYQRLRQAFDDAETGAVADLSRSLRWFSQDPRDPVFWFLSEFSSSKGSGDMVAPIECVAYLKCGDYGWTESLMFAPASEPLRTFDNAKVAFQELLSDRLQMFAPDVLFGRHIELQATRYQRDDGTHEGFPDWTPEIQLKNVKKNPEAGSIEPPFVGYLYRLYAGLQNSRNYLFRPIPDTTYMTGDGVQNKQAALRGMIEPFLNALIKQGVWAIKSIKKDVVKKDVVGVNTGALAPGMVDLYIPAHGYIVNQLVSITGGPKARKNLRGKHLVYAVPTADTIRIITDAVVVSGTGGMKVQAVQYYYPLIQTFNDIRLSKRDTGAPIAPGRGRQ